MASSEVELKFLVALNEFVAAELGRSEVAIETFEITYSLETEPFPEPLRWLTYGVM